jgi:signal transduction histidine kinase
MIAEVLEFARGYAGEVRLEPTALVAFLSAAAAPWKNKMEPMGITLVVDLQAPERLQIDLEPDRMLRVVENLLKNAQEALCGEGRDPQGKHVWLTARVDGKNAAIRVADDGPGMPDELAARVFEPFATSGKKSGTGLGLATVRNLVKAQGGEIAVTPKAPEGGAAFTVTFPIKQD